MEAEAYSDRRHPMETLSKHRVWKEASTPYPSPIWGPIFSLKIVYIRVYTVYTDAVKNKGDWGTFAAISSSYSIFTKTIWSGLRERKKLQHLLPMDVTAFI